MKTTITLFFPLALVLGCSSPPLQDSRFGSPDQGESGLIQWQDTVTSLVTLATCSFAQVPLIEDPHAYQNAIWSTIPAQKKPFSQSNQFWFAVLKDSQCVSISLRYSIYPFKELISQRLRKGSYELSIPESEMPSGMYWIRYAYPDTTYIHKFLFLR